MRQSHGVVITSVCTSWEVTSKLWLITNHYFPSSTGLLPSLGQNWELVSQTAVIWLRSVVFKRWPESSGEVLASSQLASGITWSQRSVLTQALSRYLQMSGVSCLQWMVTLFLKCIRNHMPLPRSTSETSSQIGSRRPLKASKDSYPVTFKGLVPKNGQPSWFYCKRVRSLSRCNAQAFLWASAGDSFSQWSLGTSEHWFLWSCWTLSLLWLMTTQDFPRLKLSTLFLQKLWFLSWTAHFLPMVYPMWLSQIIPPPPWWWRVCSIC